MCKILNYLAIALFKKYIYTCFVSYSSKTTLYYKGQSQKIKDPSKWLEISQTAGIPKLLALRVAQVDEGGECSHSPKTISKLS